MGHFGTEKQLGKCLWNHTGEKWLGVLLHPFPPMGIPCHHFQHVTTFLFNVHTQHCTHPAREEDWAERQGKMLIYEGQTVYKKQYLSITWSRS